VMRPWEYSPDTAVKWIAACGGEPSNSPAQVCFASSNQVRTFDAEKPMR